MIPSSPLYLINLISDVAAKTLADLRVDFVMATELGPGASGLLKHHGIRKISVKSDTRVADVIKENFGRAENKNK